MTVQCNRFTYSFIVHKSFTFLNNSSVQAHSEPYNYNCTFGIKCSVYSSALFKCRVIFAVYFLYSSCTIADGFDL